MDTVLLWNNSDYTSEYIQGAYMVRNDLWESFEGDWENESCTREKLIGPQSAWNTGSEEVNQKDMVGVCEQEDKDLASSKSVSRRRNERGLHCPLPGPQVLRLWLGPHWSPQPKEVGRWGHLSTLWSPGHLPRNPLPYSLSLSLSLSAKHHEWKAVLGALT